MIGPMKPMRNPNLSSKSGSKNLSHKELQRQATKAERKLQKLAMDRALPVPFINLGKKDVVKKQVLNPETKILGYEVLIRRRGDSFGVFSAIEKAKKKWLQWNPEQMAKVLKDN